MTNIEGYHKVIGYLRHVFRGHELPLDAKPEDFLYYVHNFTSDPMNNAGWCPSRVQFVGPKCPAEDLVCRPDRLTILFGVIKDGRRVIEDISLG